MSNEFGSLENEQMEVVSIICRRMEMLSNMVDDITALLMTDMTLSLPMEMVDMASLIRQTVNDFQYQANREDLNLVVSVTDPIPPIRGDADQLRRAVDNLLSNALKFTMAGGQIQVNLFTRQDPDGERFFIIGLDSYREIASWKDFARLFGLCHLVVTTRPGVSIENPLAPLPVAIRGDFCYDSRAGKILHKSGNYVFFLAQTRIDISSTQIRQRLLEGQSVRQLVPAAVADYIEEHGLYRTKSRSRSQ